MNKKFIKFNFTCVCEVSYNENKTIQKQETRMEPFPLNGVPLDVRKHVVALMQ